MPSVKRVSLDVLKPRKPNPLEFASILASLGPDYRVTLRVEEVDDQTESTIIEISGYALDFEQIETAIREMGGSVHSIDEVEVEGSDTDAE
jgi:hypothetical protein